MGLSESLGERTPKSMGFIVIFLTGMAITGGVLSIFRCSPAPNALLGISTATWQRQSARSDEMESLTQAKAMLEAELDPLERSNKK